MRPFQSFGHVRRFALERLEVRHLLAGDLMSKAMTEPADGDPVASDMSEFLSVLAAEGTIATDNSIAEFKEVQRLGEAEQRDFVFGFFYSIDGTGNNLQEPDWGSAGSELLRLATVDYADGISSPAGETRVSAREVTNAIADQQVSMPNDRALTDFVWQWGQFLDHDIDLTGSADPSEPFPIPVPMGDPYFDPLSTGTAEISLHRSIYNIATGTSIANPRQQLNQITAFIDGSNVYGSDQARADELRTFTGGRLKTSSGDLLPFNVNGLPNAGGPDSSLFLGGDIRANEQVGLTAMHTLFVREHNRIADNFTTIAPFLPDEWIYQLTRAIVIAEMQSITFHEFLPALLGEDAIPAYDGYNDLLDPGIENSFSTAAYRFGHSMLSPVLQRLDNAGNVIAAGNLPLRNAFFNPQEIQDHGIDPLLAGLASQKAQEIDSRLINDVRNFLFGEPGSGGFDLGSLNIQRGRDHGLPGYNQLRVDLGLDPVKSFSEMTSDPQLQKAMTSTFGTVDNVDAWVGGLCENHLPGGSVGELVSVSLVDQFTRLRDGDRLWYQRIFQGPFRWLLDHTTLAKVIHRNTDVTGLQPNVFYMANAQPDGNPDSTIVTASNVPIANDDPTSLRPASQSELDWRGFAVEPPVRPAAVSLSSAWQPFEALRSRDVQPSRAGRLAIERIHETVFAEMGSMTLEPTG